MQKQAEEVNFAVPLVLEVETSDSGASQQHSSTLWNDISLQVSHALPDVQSRRRGY